MSEPEEFGEVLVARKLNTTEHVQLLAFEESPDKDGIIVFQKTGLHKLTYFPHAPKSTKQFHLAAIDVRPEHMLRRYRVGIRDDGKWILCPDIR